MFMSIFKGKARGLGEEARESIYMKVGVDLRAHLHHFKGARLAVFMAIALHADENGESYPSYETLERETGYGSDTIATAQEALCQLEIEGHRVLVKRRVRDSEGRFVGGNHYLIFPTSEEIQMWENPDVEKTRGGKIQAEEEPLGKGEPSKKEKPLKTSHAEKSNNDFSRAPAERAQQQSLLPLADDSPNNPPASNGKSQQGKKGRPKKGANPNTQPIMDAYVEALGRVPPNYAKESAFAKKLAEEGYTPEQVVSVYKTMKDGWWSSRYLSLCKVHEEIGEVYPLGQGQNGNSSPHESEYRYLTPDNVYV